MERILNDEEKIKRAEEIYYRRNNKAHLLSNNVQEKKKRTIKDKILLNLIVMFDLAVIVFCIQNSEFIFTKEFLQVLDKYNVEASNKIANLFDYILNDEKTKEENNEKANVILENTSEDVIKEVEEIKKEDNSVSSISEMELDINNLKAAYKFVKPLNGRISSEFGARESEYQNVTGYHTGIDLVADTGTPILASMEGIVELVSSEGDYGKHVKIRCNNVYTVYAHCSKILVKEGQIVAEGQEIARVGSTGNSTGPHLHFEIRVDDRFVDPEKIIEF